MLPYSLMLNQMLNYGVWRVEKGHSELCGTGHALKGLEEEEISMSIRYIQCGLLHRSYFRLWS